MIPDPGLIGLNFQKTVLDLGSLLLVLSRNYFGSGKIASNSSSSAAFSNADSFL